MKEILTYRSEDGSTFTREFECDLGCEGCHNNNHCYIDDEVPGIQGGCPLQMSNLVSREPKE